MIGPGPNGCAALGELEPLPELDLLDRVEPSLRVIALPPLARDPLVRQPTRSGDLVFLSRTGKQLSQPTLSGYWSQVKARAGLDHDFYLASKHYGVHLLFKLGLSSRAIGAQMGWSERAVDALLRVYGHVDLIALGESRCPVHRQRGPLRSKTDRETDTPAAESAS